MFAGFFDFIRVPARPGRAAMRINDARSSVDWAVMYEQSQQRAGEGEGTCNCARCRSGEGIWVTAVTMNGGLIRGCSSGESDCDTTLRPTTVDHRSGKCTSAARSWRVFSVRGPTPIGANSVALAGSTSFSSTWQTCSWTLRSGWRKLPTAREPRVQSASSPLS